MCTLCRNQIPLTEYNFSEENAVDRIFYGRADVKKAAAFLYYSDHGIVKNLIHYLKYRNQEPIGIFLGDWFGEQLKQEGQLQRIDHVIPVPLHHRKLRKRGYNQVTEFGKRLAFHLNTEFLDHLLTKTANTRTQTKKSRFYRWQGSRDLYTLSDPAAIQNKNVLLVDDVITTGATIEACTKALQRGTQATIYVAAMAVVP